MLLEDTAANRQIRLVNLSNGEQLRFEHLDDLLHFLTRIEHPGGLQ